MSARIEKKPGEEPLQGESVLIITDRLTEFGNTLVEQVVRSKRTFAPQLQEALQSFKQGRFAETIARIRPPLEEWQDLALGHSLLALSFLHEGRLAEFVAEQRALDQLSPEVAKCLRTCYQFPVGFEELLENSLPASPIPVEPASHFPEPQQEEAVSPLQSKILLGVQARLHGKYAEALQLFEDGIAWAAGPDEGRVPKRLLAMAHFERGYTFIETKQFDKAKQCLQTAIRSNPTHVLHRARLYLQYGQGPPVSARIL